MFRLTLAPWFLIVSTIFVLCFGIPSTSTAQTPPEWEAAGSESSNPFTLNVRLSSRVIHPPKELIHQAIPLNGIQAARPRVGPPPLSAILEDDQRRRVVILSTDETGMITAYVLENLDIEPHVPEVVECTRQRHCAEDRMAMMGGLGCVAICLKDVLDRLILP